MTSIVRVSLWPDRDLEVDDIEREALRLQGLLITPPPQAQEASEPGTEHAQVATPGTAKKSPSRPAAGDATSSKEN